MGRPQSGNRAGIGGARLLISLTLITAGLLLLVASIRIIHFHGDWVWGWKSKLSFAGTLVDTEGWEVEDYRRNFEVASTLAAKGYGMELPPFALAPETIRPSTSEEERPSLPSALEDQKETSGMERETDSVPDAAARGDAETGT